MNGETSTHQHARRNRIIAIAAGAITVTAIVVAFAGEYFDLPWKWLRPGVELLLLAELVGLVVLERHQLFEPVHDKVGGIEANLAALRTDVKLLGERFDTSGQISFFASPTQTVRAIVRAMHEAIAREQAAPQILRWARLASVARFQFDPEMGAEIAEMVKAHTSFQLPPGSLPDTKPACGRCETF